MLGASQRKTSFRVVYEKKWIYLIDKDQPNISSRSSQARCRSLRPQGGPTSLKTMKSSLTWGGRSNYYAPGMLVTFEVFGKIRLNFPEATASILLMTGSLFRSAVQLIRSVADISL
ncbi:hypothetical protein RB195_023315 [Necator americanus]|uniref:Uncharacterized protein n=1 Tax=Necator americanus TaxID=51031 RepID=A0ABR1EKY1_NECAM